jgi:hypothetical protein
VAGLERHPDAGPAPFRVFARDGRADFPAWFGCNVDAWRDTIQSRGVSEVIDAHDVLIAHAHDE